jgi:hypothetical protein
MHGWISNITYVTPLMFHCKPPTPFVFYRITKVGDSNIPMNYGNIILKYFEYFKKGFLKQMATYRTLN